MEANDQRHAAFSLRSGKRHAIWIALEPARDPELVLTLRSSKIEIQIQSLPIWQFLDAFAKLRKATTSFVMSARPSVCASVHPSEWNKSALTGWIFMKFDIWEFFESLSRKFKFHCYRARKNGTLHGDQRTFFITSMFQTKVVQKIKTHILGSVIPPPQPKILPLIK